MRITDVTQYGGLTRSSVQSSRLSPSSTSSSAASAPVRRRTSPNRLVDMVRTRDRAHSLTTVVVISSIFVFITLTTTFIVAVVCCKRNAVFALQPHRHRRRGSGRHSSKSTYSPGSGSRDCEHCEMDEWRYSATAIADSSEDDGETVDSPIFDVVVLHSINKGSYINRHTPLKITNRLYAKGDDSFLYEYCKDGSGQSDLR